MWQEQSVMMNRLILVRAGSCQGLGRACRAHAGNGEWGQDTCQRATGHRPAELCAQKLRAAYALSWSSLGC
jgi:hypothetical protein